MTDDEMIFSFGGGDRQKRINMTNDESKIWFYQSYIRAERLKAYYDIMYDKAITPKERKEIGEQRSLLERILDHYKTIINK